MYQCNIIVSVYVCAARNCVRSENTERCDDFEVMVSNKMVCVCTNVNL